MAATTKLCEQDLVCPQCSEIYFLPVLLECKHNICKICLQKFWKLKGTRECPVCGIMSVPARPPINLALKIAADKFQGQRTGGNEDICCLHNDRLSIFCQNDEEPICLVCQTSKKHRVHNCCPVEEAARQKKTEISALLESLRKKLKVFNRTKDQWEETKTYIQTQASQDEKAIKEEFQELHRFLWEEEKTRLKVLKQEEEIKTQVMVKKLENIKEQINTLSSTVSEIETALKEKDLPFLKEYKQTKKRVKCNVQEPECIRDILINSAKHLGSLKYFIWKKMANIVTYTPVILDPNTAQTNLKLSEELTCVRYSSRQPLPDNTERCTNRVCVLGANGFTSGKHSLTIEVGQGKDWYIGVALESIKRKTTAFLKPAEGFWVIGMREGDFWAQTAPNTKLSLKHKPGRITVELDCEKGKVVFINADDSTTMYTFKDKFTERIFPFVSPGLCEDEKNSSPMRICPMNITVNVT